MKVQLKKTEELLKQNQEKLSLLEDENVANRIIDDKTSIVRIRKREENDENKFEEQLIQSKRKKIEGTKKCSGYILNYKKPTISNSIFEKRKSLESQNSSLIIEDRKIEKKSKPDTSNSLLSQRHKNGFIGKLNSKKFQ